MVVINLVLFSLFVTFYCLNEGGIWGVCRWHTAWNWSQGHFYGLKVTGHQQAGGTVIDLKTAGTSILSGGDFGSEASIMCTVILVTGVVAIIAKVRGGSLERTTSFIKSSLRWSSLTKEDSSIRSSPT